jgi:16S rRNA (adenine1518-N6/adenine1519-N6)-dimethyltransferase
LKAKKSFGQHFLKNTQIAEKIAKAMDGQVERILEVGPGTGNLTIHLINLNTKLKLVEADPDMVTILKKNPTTSHLEIIEKDFLKLSLEECFNHSPFGLIGNFPYNISSQIIFKMLEYSAYIPIMVGMFQKEVAERITSKPGTKSYGVISVLTQAKYTAEYLFTVDKNEFNPPPKVQSGVIRLFRKDSLHIDYNEKLFKQIVKTTFGQRRKMIRNTLKGIVPENFTLDDPYFNKRPEQLSLTDFITLTQKIENHDA